MAAPFSPARPDETELLLTLMREFYAIEHLTFRPEVSRRALAELWSNASLGRVFLIRDGGDVAGYVVLTFGFSLEFHGRDALVDELYVREAHRGRGLGGACLHWLEELCREEGIHALHLEVDRANESARRLYHRRGYRDHDRFLLTRWLES